MSGNFDVNNHVLLLVAGTIYLHAGQPESALKILHSSEHIECLALKVQVSRDSLLIIHFLQFIIFIYLFISLC